MKILSIFFSALSFIFLASCSDDTTSSNPSSYNSVSIRSVNDTLAISISCTNHNYDQNIGLFFSADTVNILMNVSGTGAGSGIFKVLNDTNTIFSRDLNSNFNLSQQIYGGPPTNSVISLQNYKGNANILVTK